MGTLINALKEIFSGSSQTSPTNIPTCASDGTPNGNTTIANLASVLGGLPKQTTNNLNEAWLNAGQQRNTVCYYVERSSNAPTQSDSGFVVSYHHASNFGSQLAICNNGFFVRFVNSNTFSAWGLISTDIPSFYKDYQTISSLKDGVAGALVGNLSTGANANTFVTEQRIICTTTALSGSQNFPSDVVYCVMKVEKIGTVVFQHIQGIDNMAYKRCRRTENGTKWSGWIEE